MDFLKSRLLVVKQIWLSIKKEHMDKLKLLHWISDKVAVEQSLKQQLRTPPMLIFHWQMNSLT